METQYVKELSVELPREGKGETPIRYPVQQPALRRSLEHRIRTTIPGASEAINGIELFYSSVIMVIKKKEKISKFHMLITEHISNCWPVPLQTSYSLVKCCCFLRTAFEGWYKWGRGHGLKLHPGQLIAFETLFHKLQPYAN